MHAGRRILILDDDPGMANAIARLLAHAGDVVAATTFESARTSIESTQYSLLIVDYVLSGWDRAVVRSPNGLDVLAAARRSALNRDTPAILLSGNHDTAAINGAAQHRARTLAKPFGEAELFQLMLDLLTPAEEMDAHVRRWCSSLSLSPSESALFALKVRGATDDECAASMSLEHSTIEEHREQIMRKAIAARAASARWEVVLNVFYRAALGLDD